MYQIMVQVSTYDAMGRPSRDVLSNEVYAPSRPLSLPPLFILPGKNRRADPLAPARSKTLSQSLQTLHATASAPPPHSLPSVPPELLEYVENGRNPDIYTREFVELVRRGNQLMRGKTRAFASFRDVLAEQMAAAMPELREDVETVVGATGGRLPVEARQKGEGAGGGGGAAAATAQAGDAGQPQPSSAAADGS